MKKILSVLAALTVFTPTVGTVPAGCGISNPFNPPKPPTPPAPPEKHDIAYYQDLIKKNQAEKDSTTADLAELRTKEAREQICGNDKGCDELTEVIDTTTVELYKNDVIISDSQYQILVLQNPDGFDEKAKAEARQWLTDEIVALNKELVIMRRYFNNDYFQKDIDEVNAQMNIAQQELNNLN